MSEHAKVRRLDPRVVVRQIVDAGGPLFAVVGPMPGGAVGAWLVRWPDGHDAVLTWAPSRHNEDSSALTDAVPVMDAARAAGVPVPRYEAVFALGDGAVAVVQERARGVPPPDASDELVARLVELSEARHGLALRHGAVPRPQPMFLTRSGPGFCLHEPLREHGPATRQLLTRIEDVGAESDVLVGSDAVHFDYHLGNVLVDERDPRVVTAIVDWGGAAWTHIGVDLVILVFDLMWRAPPLADVVEATLARRVDDRRFTMLWAHASLRLVDWSIRHHPGDVDHWVGVARRHL